MTKSTCGSLSIVCCSLRGWGGRGIQAISPTQLGLLVQGCQGEGLGDAVWPHLRPRSGVRRSGPGTPMAAAVCCGGRLPGLLELVGEGQGGCPPHSRTPQSFQPTNPCAWRSIVLPRYLCRDSPRSSKVGVVVWWRPWCVDAVSGGFLWSFLCPCLSSLRVSLRPRESATRQKAIGTSFAVCVALALQPSLCSAQRSALQCVVRVAGGLGIEG